MARVATAPAPYVVRTYKVGFNKSRPRIWIDGAVLAAAGFTGGTVYKCDVGSGFIRCSIDTSAPGRERRVTGRPDGKPIIDILGRDVETAFPNATRVSVRFGAGSLAIAREE